MKITIPKQFQLLAHTFTVEFGDPKIKKVRVLGWNNVDFLKIKLRKTINDKKLPISVIEHTYIHEVVHCMLKTLGETELNSNEKFVDGLSGLIHQWLTTAK